MGSDLSLAKSSAGLASLAALTDLKALVVSVCWFMTNMQTCMVTDRKMRLLLLSPNQNLIDQHR